MAVKRGGRTAIAALMILSGLVWRSSPAGAEVVSRDPSFAGGQGFITKDWDAADDIPSQVVVQPDGKILVAGYANVLGDDDIEVLRFNADGSPDDGFGDLGEYYFDLNGGNERAASLALLPDGRVLVGGNSSGGGLVIRLNPDGTEDTTFADNGVLLGVGISVASTLPQSDGSIVVVTTASTSATQGDIVISRYSAAGVLDPSFGTNGSTTFDSGSNASSVWWDDPKQAATLSDGSFLVAAQRSTSSYTGNPPTYSMAVRFTANGLLDTGFNGTGWEQWDFVTTSYGGEEATAVLADANGKAVVLAHLYSQGLAMLRVNPDGSLDPSFGTNGIVRDPLSATAMTRDSAGRIIAAGFGFNIELRRFSPSGALDASFNGGRYNSDIGPNNDWATSVAVQPDGRIVHVGLSWVDIDTYDVDWYVERVQFSPDPPRPPPAGYWMLRSDGVVYGFGDAHNFGDPRGIVVDRATALATAPDGQGYWVVDSFGHVWAYGSAHYFGGTPPLAVGEQVAALSSSKSGSGYWLFTNRGRVFAYGDAVSHGDMSAHPLNQPVIAAVGTASGLGYYMIGADGGVFSFGDAAFHGSMVGTRLNAPVVGIAPDPDNVGYWLVASDGGIFGFDADFRGSMGSTRLNKPVIGMVAYGDGYLMVGQDGGIFSFSDKAFAGSLGANPPPLPIVGVAPYPV